MKRHKTYVVPLAAAIVLAVSGAAFSSLAHGEQRKLKPGEKIEVGGGQSVEIFQCRGEGQHEECEVQFFRNGEAEGRKMWFSANSIRSGAERVQAAKERDAAQVRFTAGLKAGKVVPVAQPKFQPGEYIETGGGVIEEILECRGEGETAECKTVSFRDGTAVGSVNWQYVSALRAAVIRVQSARRDDSKGAAQNATNADQSPQPKTTQSTPQAAAGQATTGQKAGCNFEAPAPKYSNTDKFSANLAKRLIYDDYASSANGTGTAPVRVGVTFLAFEVGKSYKNVVRNIPVRGAQRINDAAPPNATIYRVKSKHIVCEEYRDGVQRRQVTSDYDCFKNRDDQWDCGSGGDLPPEIIQLK